MDRNPLRLEQSQGKLMTNTPGPMPDLPGMASVDPGCVRQFAWACDSILSKQLLQSHTSMLHLSRWCLTKIYPLSQKMSSTLLTIQ